MTEANVKLALTILANKVPEEKMLLLKNKLSDSTDEKLDEIMCLKLHNPSHILLFSVILGGFGVDRFMIDDIGLGVAKLLLNGITFGIWQLVDIFFSYNKAKEKNFNSVMQIL